MQRFDPPSEDDMDDNGMSRYMNAYDDEDWELKIIRESLRSRMMLFLAGEEVLAQLLDELAKQLLLALGIVVVVRQDVAPDFNLLAGVQLEVRRKFTFLGSINCAMAQFVLGLLGTVHAVESRVDLLQHHDCQSVCC